MMLVVTGVGFLIHVYSIGYMGHEGGYYRFFGYMNLFMFSMLVLVLANNYLMMFVGWEGVGLCSYLLIGFYFQRKSASDAGKKAFVVNRIGDAGFLLGVMLMAVTFGSLDFQQVTALARSGRFPVGSTRDRSNLHPAFHWRHGEVRTDSSIHLAAGRYGGPHAGERPDSCGHHGDGGCLHGGALQRAFHPGAHGDGAGGWDWRRDRHLGGKHRTGPKRHQARAGLLDRSASSGTCFWPAVWGRSARESSI